MIENSTSQFQIMYGLLGRRKKNHVTNTIEKQHFVMTKNNKGKKQKLSQEKNCKLSQLT